MSQHRNPICRVTGKVRYRERVHIPGTAAAAIRRMATGPRLTATA